MQTELYTIIGVLIMTVIMSSVLIILVLAVIASNARKENKLLKRSNELLENLLLNQSITIAGQQNYRNYYGNNQQYNQNQTYKNPYMK